MFPRPLMLALVPLALLAGPAFAQENPTSNASDSSQDAPRQIRDRLAEEGFKDIRIEPGSYIVIAKDKQNRPVMMMIGPNSTTMLTSPDAVPDAGDSTAQLPTGQDGPIPQ